MLLDNNNQLCRKKVREKEARILATKIQETDEQWRIGQWCHLHTAFRNSLSRAYFESRTVVAYVDLMQKPYQVKIMKISSHQNLFDSLVYN